MLLEAVISVVIVSICLTFIAQSLLTNFRTGVRFQEMVRSLVIMENRLGLLYVTSASDDQIDPSAMALEKPDERFTVRARTDTINDHLRKIGLTLNWPAGKTQGQLDVTTFIYNPDDTKARS